MARIDHLNAQSMGSGHHDTGRVTTIQADHQSVIHLPSHDFIAHADLARDGYNLVATGADGSKIIVEGYFLSNPPPTLATPQGQLTPDLVQSFVHNVSGVQVAGLNTTNDASPVGTVKEVSGHATILHSDGTREDVTAGMPVHEGDVIETDAKGAVNLVFSDESSFAVSENAKLAIDKYVFDPHSHSGDSGFSMLRGLFVYTSGLIGREDPDDVKIHTPVGSIGIRGTVIAGNVTTGEITVVEGAIVLHAPDGHEVTLSNQYETARFANGSVDQAGILTAADIGTKFSSIGGVAPAFYSGLGDHNGNGQQNRDSQKQGEPTHSVAPDHNADTGEHHSQADTPNSTSTAAQAQAVTMADLSPTANAFGDTNSFSSAAASFSAPNTVTAAVTAPSASGSAAPPVVALSVAAPATTVASTPVVATTGSVIPQPPVYTPPANTTAGTTNTTTAGTVATTGLGAGFTVTDNINEAFGSGFAAARDLNGDGFDDVLIVKGTGTTSNLVFTLRGAASGTDTTAPGLNNFATTFSGTHDKLSIDYLGHYSGTGTNIIVGAPHANDTTFSVNGSGEAYVLSSSGSFVAQLINLSAGDLTGQSVAGIGDINHDGYSDALIGAPGASSSAGAAYILFGASALATNPAVNVANMADIQVYGSGTSVSGQAADMVIQGQYSYVVSSDTASLDIINIGSPSLPMVSATITSSDIIGAGGPVGALDNARAIAVQGSFAYITGNTSGLLTVINISNPAAPAYASSYTDSLLANANSIAVRGNVIVATSATTGNLTIVNATTMSAYNHVTGLSGASAVAFSTSGRYAYVADTAGIVTVDLNNPATPVTSGPLTGTGLTGISGMVVEGGMMYAVSSSNNMLFAISLNAEGSPVVVGSYTDPNISGASGISVVNGIAYVTGATNSSLAVIDVHSPTGMHEINHLSNNSFITGASGVAVDSNGLVHVIAPTNNNYEIFEASPSGIAIHGATANSLTGSTVAAAGDFNGDGFNDFAIASPGTAGNGHVDIVFGAQALNSVTLGAGTFSLTGIAVNTAANHLPVIYGGDMNGDGISDIAVFADNGNGGKGLFHVVYGATTYTAGGSLNVSSGLNGTNGFTVTTGAGTQHIVSGGMIGDFNGDGYADGVVIVKDPGSYSTDIYVFYGHSTATADGTLTLAEMNNAANALHMTYTIPSSFTAPDNFTFTVSAAGDLNGDGLADIIIGVPSLDTNATADSSGNGNTTDDTDGASIVVYGQGAVTNVTDGSAFDANTAANSITASANGQSLVGNSLANILSDGGLSNTSFHAGAGNDTINLSASAFRSIDGGAGIDTIQFMQSAGTLDFSGVKSEAVQRIEAINMGGTSQTLNLTMGNIFSMLQSSDNGNLNITSTGSGSTNTLVIDNQAAGSQTGANATQIAAMIGASTVITQANAYDFHIGAATVSIDKALVDGGHVNIA